MIEKPIPCLPQIGPDNSTITSIFCRWSSRRIVRTFQTFLSFLEAEGRIKQGLPSIDILSFLNEKTTRTLAFSHLCNLWTFFVIFVSGLQYQNCFSSIFTEQEAKFYSCTLFSYVRHFKKRGASENAFTEKQTAARHKLSRQQYSVH